MIDVEKEIENLCKGEEQQIGKVLYEYGWKYKETMEQLGIGWRKVSKVRKPLRRNLVITIWKKYKLNLSEIEKATKISRHTISGILKPLGYQPNRKHDEERKKFLDSAYQELLQKDQPTLRRLDQFIVEQQLNGILNYADAKKRVYRAFPDIAVEMRNKMTILTLERKKELGVGEKLTHTGQARKSFIQGLLLDFPKTNVYQRAAILDGHPERVHRLRDLSDKELNDLKAEFNQGYTVSQLAEKFDVSYKKMIKSLKQKGIDPKSEQYRKKLRTKSIANLPRDNTKATRAKREKENAKARVPHSYLGDIPSWAWDLVEQERELLWFDKIASFFSSKEKIIKLLKTANDKLGRPISISELDLLFPPLQHVRNVSERIYRRYGQDQDIKKLTSQGKSNFEKRITELLDSLGVNYTVNDRKVIKGMELDFYIENKSIAIEVSPIRMHNSNQFRQIFHVTKPANYHQKKEQLCGQKGMKLIALFQKHLSEPTWSRIIVPMLKRQILGCAEKTYYARQTVVRPIDKSSAKQFLNEWHIDGYVPSRYAYGIFKKGTDELLGVATFGLPQVPAYKQQGYLELKRLGWRADVQVRYGISKIMADVRRDLASTYKGLMTFSDNNIGQGQGYEKAGFTLLKESKPQLTYVNPNHPADHYSWSVATSWGAKSGVIAQKIHPMAINNKQARKIVEEELPWRIGNGHGYFAQYDTGNRLWIKIWD